MPQTALAKPKRCPGHPKVEPWEAFKAAERKGRYTASRLRKERPGIYDAIIGLLFPSQGDGMSLTEIAHMFRVDKRTVIAVRDQNPEPIEASRARRIAKLLTYADLQIERGIDDPDSISPDRGMLNAAIAIDKAQLLSGQATQIIEEHHTVDVRSQYTELIAHLSLNGNSSENGSELPLKSANPLEIEQGSPSKDHKA